MMSGYCTVVTGAAGGIGRVVVSSLLAEGKRVVAVDAAADRLEELFGGNPDAVCVGCDLSLETAVDAVAAAVASCSEGVEGFVHAAGGDSMAPLGMVESETMHGLFAVHAVFPALFLGWLAKKRNHAPGASAVLVSSVSAHEGAKGRVAYAAAKGAVEGMLKPAAAELAAKGMRLNAVVLGIVETDMSRQWMAKLPEERIAALRMEYPLGFGSPENAAGAICFLLSRQAAWIAGQTIVCDGGHSLA